MSVIWSGVTAEGAVVPVQVTDEGKVVAVGDGPQGDYLPTSGGNLTGDLTLGTDEITLNATDGSAAFAGGNIVLNPGGAIQSAGGLYSGFNFENNSYGAYIQADGSASFAGDVLCGTTPTLAKTGVKLQEQGGCYSVRDVGEETSRIFAGGVVGNDEVFQVTGAGDVKIGGSSSAPNITLNAADGSASFAHQVNVLRLAASDHPSNNGLSIANELTKDQVAGISCGGALALGDAGIGPSLRKIYLNGADGSAVFSGDVVIGSRGEKWLIRESNGVAMLVPQSREAAPMSGVSPMIPEKVRDIPSELDLIEMALNEVMEKLRMTPPAGWPVWDGSDNP